MNDLPLTYAVYFTPLLGALLIAQFIHFRARRQVKLYDARLERKRAELAGDSVGSMAEHPITPRTRQVLQDQAVQDNVARAVQAGTVEGAVPVGEIATPARVRSLAANIRRETEAILEAVERTKPFRS